MDFLSLLRTLGALGVVLGLLVGALWAVRRFELTLPQNWLTSLHKQGVERRLEVLEKLSIDQRRSIILIRRDDQEYGILIAPEGIVMLDPKQALQAPAPISDSKTQDHD